jgi:hypothetical protein
MTRSFQHAADYYVSEISRQLSLVSKSQYVPSKYAVTWDICIIDYVYLYYIICIICIISDLNIDISLAIPG